MNYIADLHTHTVMSGHAYSSMREMAQAAADKGLEILGITEHAMSMPWTCGDYYFQNLRMVDRYMCGIELMLGSEVNITGLDGSIDMSERMMKDLDVIIFSMHMPCIKSGTRKENTRAYLYAMQSPYVDIIGHPDDDRFPVDFEELVRGAKDRGILLEVNNNSLDPRCNREGGRENYRTMLKLCMQYGQSVIVNSDAHVDQLVGRHEEAYALMQEIEFPEELVVNHSGKKLKSYLRKYK